ncbi:MAG: hypothetical protein NZ521_11410, partial [Flammeovirgaceae bacterium]|nr:hypothetical protein [Flammeovirgaceae bacterium]MDW8288802.1 hypothetical protein [Flammeovirgaceae bacterium]
MKDVLWKGIIEDLFREFLYYFYGKWAKKNVDFEKGFQFLDNELHAIYPERASKRIVDKLVKVYLKNGKEQWF